MKTRHLCAWLTMIALLPATARAAGPLPRSTPEAQGVSPSGILAFVEAADKEINSLHSLMVVRHGSVVAEGWWAPYDAATPHVLFSLSKSFTSTAVGLAVAEGKLSVDDELLKLFPDDAPPDPSANLKSMRIRDLLRMSAGHQTEVKLTQDMETPWTKAFLAHPVPFKPGTHFLYNTPATYMLSAAVQKATGKSVFDFLQPRLFEPLGIEGAKWDTSPQGISLGGYGLSVRTEDIAKFGQLYLQKGKWNGQQLIPESWVNQATARQTSNGSNPKSDWEQGYGYQFWRARHHAYRGDGAFGQYCLVIPEHDAVIAITSGLKDMQAVLNLVWDHILPALKSSSLAPDDDARTKLEHKLARLSIRTPEGSKTPGSAVALGKTYRFATNEDKLESLTLEKGTEGEAAGLTLRYVGGKDQRIPCPVGSWTKAKFTPAKGPEQAVATAAAWTADDTLTVRVVFRETPFRVTQTLKFAADRVTFGSESNVSFGPTKKEPLEGKVE